MFFFFVFFFVFFLIVVFLLCNCLCIMCVEYSPLLGGNKDSIFCSYFYSFYGIFLCSCCFNKLIFSIFYPKLHPKAHTTFSTTPWNIINSELYMSWKRTEAVSQFIFNYRKIPVISNQCRKSNGAIFVSTP